MIDQCFGSAVAGTVNVGPGALSRLVTEATSVAGVTDTASWAGPAAANTIVTARIAIRTLCFFTRMSLPFALRRTRSWARLFSIIYSASLWNREDSHL